MSAGRMSLVVDAATKAACIKEVSMKKLALVTLVAGMITSTTGVASAQYLYFGYGDHPRYGYGDYPRYRNYDGPRPYYRERSYGERRALGSRGYYPPGGFRTWNGCQQGWTVQDGLCKPYRGY